MYTTKLSDWPPGAYGRVQGRWHIRDPKGALGCIDGHAIVEHDDGTITASPSILNLDPGGYHGWLTRGVWREA